MTSIATPEPEYLVDDAQLAAAAFPARYSGRMLDAYRHLRGFFQWAADNAIPVLDGTRPHIGPDRTRDGATWPGRIDHLRGLPIRSHRSD
jgi:hypothetical protein